MKKILFIYNPMSGQKTISSQLGMIVDYFCKHGYVPTVYATQKQGDARYKVREYAKFFDEIVVSGGDGTLDEVVSGLLRSDTNSIIGYIPTGSTNDFSRSLNIPTDIKKATKLSINGQIMDIDLGKFNSKFFTYVAAFGSFAQVSYETEQSMKNIFGRFAYILEGVKTVSNLKSYHAKITIDEEEFEGDFIHFMATNSVSVGGFNNFYKKNIGLDDGIFESVLVKKPNGLLELNSIIEGLRSNKENENIIFRSGSSFKVESDEKIDWTLDGDFGGSYTKSEVKVLNMAVKFRTGFSRDSEKIKANQEKRLTN
ncbi:diacylglycerol kinase family lipid kinase [Anaerococcus sp. WCA-380-WT-2B]|uniref:Diacylglycerol kinase family lipid kinase n=1 Tax=Anaerococcus porci TaxID=2652269 RepID=A0A6N7VXF3_9FIRM|nr:diacylglycerol kinase family protein [Anaerococcus porci]MSS78704.1 diacylglycerol kinase family lipid kinase [Anaerococcus porci]